MLTPNSKHASDAADKDKALPEPRVGATSVWHDDALYLWGGRGGQDMTPLDAFQVGVWKATINASDGPQQSVTWERIAAANEEQAPESRSYHASVAHGVRTLIYHLGQRPSFAALLLVYTHWIPQDNIYIHAGCPASGRLSTLHAFNVKDGAWKHLTSAPEPGRGGTSLAAITVAGNDLLLRYGGMRQLPTSSILA